MFDQIWYTCAGQWATTLTKFWARLAKIGEILGLDESRGSSFFVVKTRRLFGNFKTVDFRQHWPRHVNLSPQKYWKYFRKFF